MKAEKKKVVKKSRYITEDGYSYLTKRIIVSRARAAGKLASQNAMNVMGYVVVVQNNSVVKKYADGRIEVIAAI